MSSPDYRVLYRAVPAAVFFASFYKIVPVLFRLFGIVSVEFGQYLAESLLVYRWVFRILGTLILIAWLAYHWYFDEKIKSVRVLMNKRDPIIMTGCLALAFFVLGYIVWTFFFLEFMADIVGLI